MLTTACSAGERKFGKVDFFLQAIPTLGQMDSSFRLPNIFIVHMYGIQDRLFRISMTTDSKTTLAQSDSVTVG